MTWITLQNVNEFLSGPLNAISPSPGGDGLIKHDAYRLFLHFGNSNGLVTTNLNTGFTAQTFFSFNRLGLAVFHLEYLSRACCHAFFTSSTFFFVYDYFKHNYTSRIELKKGIAQ